MNERRRDFVLAFGGASLLLAVDLIPLRACAPRDDAWNAAAIETRSLIDAVKAMGGAGHAVASEDVTIISPDSAEHGTIVPFTVASKVPNTRHIALLVGKHPNVVIANFPISHGTDPRVDTHVKMGETSNIIALVKADDGKFYYASKEVKVTAPRRGG